MRLLRNCPSEIETGNFWIWKGHFLILPKFLNLVLAFFKFGFIEQSKKSVKYANYQKNPDVISYV